MSWIVLHVREEDDAVRSTLLLSAFPTLEAAHHNAEFLIAQNNEAELRRTGRVRFKTN